MAPPATACRPIDPREHASFLPDSIPPAEPLRAEPCEGLDRSFGRCGTNLRHPPLRCARVSMHAAGWGSYLEALAFDSWLAEARGIAPLQLLHPRLHPIGFRGRGKADRESHSSYLLRLRSTREPVPPVLRSPGPPMIAEDKAAEDKARTLDEVGLAHDEACSGGGHQCFYEPSMSRGPPGCTPPRNGERELSLEEMLGLPRNATPRERANYQRRSSATHPWTYWHAARLIGRVLTPNSRFAACRGARGGGLQPPATTRGSGCGLDWPCTGHCWPRAAGGAALGSRLGPPPRPTAAAREPRRPHPRLPR